MWGSKKKKKSTLANRVKRAEARVAKLEKIESLKKRLESARKKLAKL